jgi:class 3 adenylate cyclase
MNGPGPPGDLHAGRDARRDVELVDRTFLYTDIVSSTAILSRFGRERGSYRGVESFDREIREAHNGRISEHLGTGEIVNVIGDAYLVAFRDPREAIQCAVSIQRSLTQAPIPVAVQGAGVDLPATVQIRIGLHKGLVMRVETEGRLDYLGDTVNIACRIRDLAHGERILASQDAWNRAGRLEGLRGHGWPDHQLKGVDGTYTLVEVLWDDRAPREPERERVAPAPTAADLGRLRAAYLEILESRYEWLDFTGVPQVRNVVRLRLGDIFVPLATTRELPEGDVLRAEVALRRHLGEAPGEMAEPSGREVPERTITLEQALEAPRLVILGEPGSGKTTILKHIAVRLATGRGPELGQADPEQAPLPILLPVAAYAAALRERDRALTDYLGDHFAARDQPGLAPLFQDALERGRAIVLLDGLDEVLNVAERAQVARRVQEFVRRFGPARGGAGGNRFVVTSRIAGYEAARLAEFTHVTVLPFRDEDVRRFCDRWCLAWERVTDASAAGETRAQERARELIRAIDASESVQRLATNPLLLTIIALIHYQNVRLPERRVDLYRLAVEALAETWNRARNLDRQAIEPRLGDRPLTTQFVINVLGPVALWLHETPPGGLMEGRELRAKLAEALRKEGNVSHRRALDLADGFLDLVRQSSGLLQERGVGQYGFSHLTFEEYLAARAITDLDANPQVALLGRWPDPAWREVILLGVGTLTPAQASQTIEALLAAPAAGEARGRNVVLAGQAVADVGPDRVRGDVRQTTIGRLVELVEERNPAKLASLPTRALVGRLAFLARGHAAYTRARARTAPSVVA